MLNSSESTSQDEYLDTIDDKQLVSLIDDDLITSPNPLEPLPRTNVNASAFRPPRPPHLAPVTHVLRQFNNKMLKIQVHGQVAPADHLWLSFAQPQQELHPLVQAPHPPLRPLLPHDLSIAPSRITLPPHPKSDKSKHITVKAVVITEEPNGGEVCLKCRFLLVPS